MKTVAIISDRSNSGKTTISIGLMSLLRKYGSVRGYKIGPDFIDPKFHEKATGLDSINLDYYIMGNDIKKYFVEYSRGIDFGVVEGVMGLYDGIGGRYSTYEIISLLNIPAIAVIDCSFNSTTASAILFGLKNYKNAEIRGVIFNNVASESHFKDCSLSLPEGIINLGYVKNIKKIEIKSRHLGLILPDETTVDKIKYISEIIEETIDLGSLISIMRDFEFHDNIEKAEYKRDRTAAIAFDNAFSFYYKSNIDLISKKFNIRFFSPLRNEKVDDADLIYIGGGYPELFAKDLESNYNTKSWIKKSSENGKLIFGECGGLMYLSSYLEVGEKTYEMTRIFDTSITMNSGLTIGYTELKIDSDNVFYSKDEIIRGHEFHKSKVMEYHENTIMKNIKGKGLGDGRDGMLYNNSLATYSHFIYNGSEKFLKMINSNI